MPEEPAMNRPGTEYNIASVMLRRAQLSPERRALVFEDRESSYAEFADRVRRNPGHGVGVCLTLTSPSPIFRLRLLSDRCEVPSLVDPDRSVLVRDPPARSSGFPACSDR